MSAPDLAAAATVIDIASGVVDAATRRLAAAGSIDDHQIVDLAAPGPRIMAINTRRS